MSICSKLRFLVNYRKDRRLYVVISVEVLSSFNHVVSSTLEKLKLTYTLAMYKINEKFK